jgi:hypothetical protein
MITLAIILILVSPILAIASFYVPFLLVREPGDSFWRFVYDFIMLPFIIAIRIQRQDRDLRAREPRHYSIYAMNRRSCPFCRESIKIGARFCRFCRSSLPYGWWLNKMGVMQGRDSSLSDQTREQIIGLAGRSSVQPDYLLAAVEAWIRRPHLTSAGAAFHAIDTLGVPSEWEDESGSVRVPESFRRAIEKGIKLVG